MSLYTQKRQNNAAFRAFTGLNIEEFDMLVPLFHDAWEHRMEETTVDGKYRWNRRHVTYRSSPLPTSADKLFFILVYLKQATTQDVHGALFGLSQSNANKWIHTLLPPMSMMCLTSNLIPARDVDELRHFFTTQSDDTPFLSMTEQNVLFNDQVMIIPNTNAIVVRKNDIL